MKLRCAWKGPISHHTMVIFSHLGQAHLGQAAVSAQQQCHKDPNLVPDWCLGTCFTP